MRTSQYCPLLLLIFLATTACGQYQGPESVEYDPVGDRYFVSNTQSNSIKVRTQDGTVTDFVSGMPNAPYGLEIMGGVLYACTGNGVRGYSLATGEQVYVRNLGATFPNGITTDGTFLYITDFSSNPRRVLKVDPVADTHSTLVPNAGGQPNGIVWDPVGQRLVTVFWGSNAPIKAYDRDSGAETILVANTGVGNIDGVTIDCDGNFLIASWSPARISRYEPTFSQAAVNMNVPGLSNPADIDFDQVNQRICIPNSGNNTVVLHDYDCLTSGLATMHAGQALRVYPNPAAYQVQLEPAPTHALAYLLLDAHGRPVREGVYRPGMGIGVAGLASGTYSLHLPSEGRTLRVVLE
jgi:hypothetical protein